MPEPPHSTAMVELPGTDPARTPFSLVSMGDQIWHVKGPQTHQHLKWATAISMGLARTRGERPL